LSANWIQALLRRTHLTQPLIPSRPVRSLLDLEELEPRLVFRVGAYHYIGGRGDPLGLVAKQQTTPPVIISTPVHTGLSGAPVTGSPSTTNPVQTPPVVFYKPVLNQSGRQRTR
jgi:hypothetical protein